jgi:hypothetical protein
MNISYQPRETEPICKWGGKSGEVVEKAKSLKLKA